MKKCSFLGKKRHCDKYDKTCNHCILETPQGWWVFWNGGMGQDWVKVGKNAIISKLGKRHYFAFREKQTIYKLKAGEVLDRRKTMKKECVCLDLSSEKETIEDFMQMHKKAFTRTDYKNFMAEYL